MNGNLLPKGWVEAPLGDLGRWVGGGTPSKANASFWIGSIPWISAKDMKTRRITVATDYISEKAIENSAASLIPPESILLVVRSGILEHTLPVSVNKMAVTINQDLKALSPVGGLSAEYLAHALDAASQSILHACRKEGTTVASIEISRLLDFKIAIAPLREQGRIVSELDTQLARLEAGVTEIGAQSARLATYRASVLKAACEGRLVPTEAELARAEGRKFESGGELLSRLLPRESGGFAWRGPDGWGSALVEQLNPTERPCAYGVLQPGDDDPEGVPLVRVGDINDGKVDLSALKRIAPAIANRYPRTRLMGNEVLVTLVGAIGRTAVAPESLGGANVARAVGVIPLIDEIAPAWVEIWLRNPAMIREMTAKSHEVARKTLNLEDVRAARIAIPPLPEQHRIVAEVSRRLSVVEQLEAAIDRSLQRAARLRQAILKQAFEGRLVPQDPRDEPASVLLERIRGEREKTVQAKISPTIRKRSKRVD